MESIMQYISVHWVSWVFGIISVLLSGAYHKLSKQLKAERARTNAINAGVLALLHDRLYQACTFYLKGNIVPWKTETIWSICSGHIKHWVEMEPEKIFYNRCLAFTI